MPTGWYSLWGQHCNGFGWITNWVVSKFAFLTQTVPWSWKDHYGECLRIAQQCTQGITPKMLSNEAVKMDRTPTTARTEMFLCSVLFLSIPLRGPSELSSVAQKLYKKIFSVCGVTWNVFQYCFLMKRMLVLVQNISSIPRLFAFWLY